MTTYTAAMPLDGRRAAMHAFLALLLRDLRVMRRNVKAFLLRTVMQPLLFVFVFSYVFPKIGQSVGGTGGGGTGAEGPTFSTILVPGLLAVAIIFQGIQTVALPLTQEFSYTKEIEDRVLAPLPVWAVGVGKIVNGAVQAMAAALVVFPLVRYIHAAGQAPDIDINWPAFLVVLVLASVMGASLGLLIGTSVAPQQVPLVFSVIVLPITMLGCIYYPWAALDRIPWLQYSVLVNPLVYMSEAMRMAVTPDLPHMDPLAVFGAMLAAVALMGTLSLRKFRTRVVG